MEVELLGSVEYIDGDVKIKVTKAGFRAPEAEITEAKGKEEDDEATLFWSSEGPDIPVL